MAAPVEQLTCAKDGTSTRLTCVECRTPICPLCLVRTPVGMKCAGCAAGVAGAGAGARRSWSSRSRWVVAAPLAVVVAVVGAIAVPRLLSSPKKPDRRIETYNPSAEARPAAPYTFGGIGREVIDQNLAFTVTAVECGAASVGARTAQGKFCLISLSVRNVSRTAVTLDSSAQTLTDGPNGAGRKFQVDPGATAAHPSNAGKDMLSPVVNPGNELAGVLVYDVPPDAHPVSLSLHAGAAGFGAIISFPPG